MKIGILTFHRAHNYGAVYQVYALQETLKSKGHQVQVVDYRSSVNNIYLKENFFKRKNIISLAANILFSYRRFSKRHKAFEQYIDNQLNLSKEINSVDEMDTLDFDYYVVGSDQVWNPKITKGFDPIYWGDFNKSLNQKKIAYAVSMESETINEEDKNKIQSLLHNFKAIGSRENVLTDLLQPLSKQKIETVIDPTLLANKELFIKDAITPKQKEKYIVAYQVKKSEDTRRISEYVAEKMGIRKIIEIGSGVSLFPEKNVHPCYSPNEVLGLIKDAAFVVTTSFHGTAFAVIFNKPFYSIKLKHGGTRVQSLLSQLGIQDRIITYKNLIAGKTVLYSEDIKWDNVEQILEEKRNESLDFLLKNID